MLAAQDRVRGALLAAVAEVAARPEECARDPGRDFTRRRKVTLDGLLWTITTMGTGTLGVELLRARGMSADAPSAPALCQQWAKLNDEAMPRLHAAFLSRFGTRAWRGRYQLLAVDGTGVAMAPDPRDAETRLPPARGAAGRNEAHATCSYDVLMGVYRDMVVQGGRSEDEHAAAAELVRRHAAPPGLEPLWLADRGFLSLNLFDAALRAGAHLVVRAADARVAGLLRHELGGARPDGELDVTVERCVVRSAGRRWRSRPDEPWLYRRYDSSRRFDSLPAGSREERWLTLRVVRVGVPGGWLNLVTDLPASELPARELADLYLRRWSEEVAFDELKHAVWDAAPHVRGLARLTQELWGRLTLHAACSLMLAEVPPPASPSRATDRAAGLRVCAEALRGGRLVDVEAVCSRLTQAVRPGRRFERRRRPQRAPCHTRRH